MTLLPHTSKAANLYIAGLRYDGQPITLVGAGLGFWEQQRTEQDRGGPGDAYLPDLLPSMRDRAQLVARVIELSKLKESPTD